MLENEIILLMTIYKLEVEFKTSSPLRKWQIWKLLYLVGINIKGSVRWNNLK